MIAGSPEVVEAAADQAQRAGRDLGEVAEDVSQHGQAATNQWEGVASDAALRHISALAVSTRVGADVLALLGPVLRTYAVELRTAQREYAHGQAVAAAGATALGSARADAVVAAAMETDDPQRSLATQDAADAVRAATAQKGEGAADMAAAVQRAAMANDAAARAVNDLTGQLSGMKAPATTTSEATSTTAASADGGSRHGWAYNAFGGAGNAMWDTAPGLASDLLKLSPFESDREIAEKIDGAHDWLERWYGADTESDAYGNTETGVAVATFFVPGTGELKAVKAATEVRKYAPWLERMFAGSRWHKMEQARLMALQPAAAAEVFVLKPGQTIASTAGKLSPRYNRVDLYDPKALEIVSMKHTELFKVKPETAKKYLDELATKYPPGTVIADTPINRDLGLAGQQMTGQMILHVRKQAEVIRPEILQYAKKLNITIRQGSEG